MNWKEQPHLFANGKFKIDMYPFSSIENDIWDIIGVIDGELLLERKNVNPPVTQQPPEHCTLLARPIADLSDEETQWFIINGDPVYDVDDFEGVRGYLKESYIMGTMNAEELIQMLSIGVYPFDQSHFQTGEVLNINEVTA